MKSIIIHKMQRPKAGRSPASGSGPIPIASADWAFELHTNQQIAEIQKAMLSGKIMLSDSELPTKLNDILRGVPDVCFLAGPVSVEMIFGSAYRALWNYRRMVAVPTTTEDPTRQPKQTQTIIAEKRARIVERLREAEKAVTDALHFSLGLNGDLKIKFGQPSALQEIRFMIDRLKEMDWQNATRYRRAFIYYLSRLLDCFNLEPALADLLKTTADILKDAGAPCSVAALRRDVDRSEGLKFLKGKATRCTGLILTEWGID